MRNPRRGPSVRKLVRQKRSILENTSAAFAHAKNHHHHRHDHRRLISRSKSVFRLSFLQEEEEVVAAAAAAGSPETTTLEDKSATKIQAGVRGFLVRKRQQAEQAAATTIQAGFRGFRTRKLLKQSGQWAALPVWECTVEREMCDLWWFFYMNILYMDDDE